MKTIVFIEGVSGVGKSTIAVRLCERLNAKDRSLNRPLAGRALIEGDVNNPVELFNCAYLTAAEFDTLLQVYLNESEALRAHAILGRDYVLVRYADLMKPYFASPLLDYLKAKEGFYKAQAPIALERYAQVYEDLWRSYIQQATEDTLILDGCLLSHRANDLTANYNADDKAIAKFMTVLLSVFAEHQVFLFYLSADDVGERLISARESRGESKTTYERISAEIERKSHQLRILELLPVRADTFDITDGDWDAAGDAMENLVLSARSRGA